MPLSPPPPGATLRHLSSSRSRGIRRWITASCVPLVLAATSVEAADYVFRYGHSHSANHPRSESMRYFEKELETRSDERIDVTLFFDGTLGREEDVIQQVQMGIIQGTRSGLFAQANPAYQLFLMPFLFDDTDQVLEVVHSEIGDQLAAGALDNQIYIPATGLAGGMRQLTNNVHPVRSLDDMHGLKIRTPPFPVTIRAFEALGASPQQIPFTETYMALQTGVVDGQENPPSNIYDMRFQEAQDYLTVLNWQINPDPFFISAKWYRQLPEDLQQIVTEVAEETMERSTTAWLAAEQGFLDRLGETMEIDTLSTAERSEFVEAVAPIWQTFVDDGVFTQQQLDTVLALTGKTEIQP
ncbi:TRAP transporter substrate-binding protein [Halomonas sp. V046]|uniref:TRAP transporter substrate-binding protein n=1 Tax=Halomonas sp. V046 TaxID=3459611 RepID=UPI00404430CD